MSDETFGELLRAYRLAAGLSQERIAEDAGLSVVSISALERGLRQAPYRQTVQLIIKALRLSVDQAGTLEAAADRARKRTPATGGNAPATTGALIGRATDVANIARLLGPNRLVTITGTAGVGKTRVAIEVSSSLRRSFGPPAFVDLATVQNGSLLCDAIASALGDMSTVEHSEPETLARAVGARHSLLVLDTCEHMVPSVAAAAIALLRACPNLTIVATSRQRLGIRGELVYRLTPLETPTGSVSGLAEAQTYAAVNMFIQRAVSSARRVSFTDADTDVLVSICRTIDGIPLSIELAAARARTLGLQTLSERLQAGFEPGRVNRDGPPRHRTTVASIEWSYRLLTSIQQRVFVELSLFPGSFTLEAAERVCVANGIDEAAICDALLALVETNLIDVEAAGGARHYRMLNTLRLFASQRRLRS